ncbi:MAG: YgaP family membrane protein [Helicobacteraceae bacterium]
MTKYDKVKKFCRQFRIFLGLVLILVGVITGIYWFYLGIIPLLVGVFDFCPICFFTKKCTPKNLK